MTTPVDVRDALVATVRDFVDREVMPIASKLDHDDVYPTELVEKLGAMGFFGATIPESHGGMGLDFATYAMCVEEPCRGFMSLSGVFKRIRLLDGVPSRALLPRRTADDHRRRHERDPAPGDRSKAT